MAHLGEGLRHRLGWRNYGKCRGEIGTDLGEELEQI